MTVKDYTIYHITHGKYLQKHSLKCHLLSDETVHLFDGTGYPSFAKVINTCVANCPTETVIIFSHKVYPFPDEIEKILFYLNKGYALVGLYRLAIFGIKKELFRKIGFMDERFLAGSFEDEDLLIRIRINNLAIYISYECFYGKEAGAWRNSRDLKNVEDLKIAQNHFNKKWKKRIKNFSEESYDYDLGPSTNQEFLSWNDSILSFTFDELPSRTEVYNICDEKLTIPPLSNMRVFERYLNLNKYRDANKYINE